jgi:hypothetical protein
VRFFRTIRCGMCGKVSDAQDDRNLCPPCRRYGVVADLVEIARADCIPDDADLFQHGTYKSAFKGWGLDVLDAAANVLRDTRPV